MVNSNRVESCRRLLKLPANWALHFQQQVDSPLLIDKKGNDIQVTYRYDAEAFRALLLLKENAAKQDFHLSETPRFAHDGVMVDCSRNGVPNLPALKRFITNSALLGLDVLMLYTEDVYPIPNYPYFGYQRGRYSQEELKEIDAFAASFGIELVPCIETLGHLGNPLGWAAFEPIKENDFVLLPGEEATYRFLDAAVASCRACFRSHRIHVGMDETGGVGFGKSYLLHGYQDPLGLYVKHLAKVVEICQRYSFEPMMWSDMFFRFANATDYYGPNPATPELKQDVPAAMSLVYWDYYHDDFATYQRMITNHKALGKPVIFAGGSWRWVGFAPFIERSLSRSRLALKACLEGGINEVFLTGWGDNGNECAFATMYPALVLYAEYSYEGHAEDAVISSRLKALTGNSLQDFLLLDLPNQPSKTCIGKLANPCKYLFYQDPIGGLFDKHLTPDYPATYAKYAKTLLAEAKKSPHYAYMYDTLGKLCLVLALKSNLGADLRKAYLAKDKLTLKRIAEVQIPVCIKAIRVFQKSLEKEWNLECKPYGFDILDGRIGWLLERLATAKRRALGYVHDPSQTIPELAEPLLYFDCRTSEYDTEGMMWNWWAKNVSANPL
jgi:hexosaminidase